MESIQRAQDDRSDNGNRGGKEFPPQGFTLCPGEKVGTRDSDGSEKGTSAASVYTGGGPMAILWRGALPRA